MRSSPALWEQVCCCFLSCQRDKPNLNQSLIKLVRMKSCRALGPKHQEWITQTYILNVYKSMYLMLSSVKQS